MRPAVILLLVAALVPAALNPASAEAQIRLRSSESQLLRQSAALESEGDFDGAETLLRLSLIHI